LSGNDGGATAHNSGLYVRAYALALRDIAPFDSNFAYAGKRNKKRGVLFLTKEDFEKPLKRATFDPEVYRTGCFER